MADFGWSYPPGCSGPPDDNYTPSELVEKILVILEDAGVPYTVNDKIVAILENWEAQKAEEQNNELDLDSRILSDEYPR